MADIVQIKEDGVAKYVKTHVKAVEGLKEELLEMIYPVGSIYISKDNANPEIKFGGTWERFGKGRTLVSVNESDSVINKSGLEGGSVNPLTAHFHTITGKTYRGNGSGTTNTLARSLDLANPVSGTIADTTAASAGNSSNHANWQPFITVYMWVRTD